MDFTDRESIADGVSDNGTITLSWDKDPAVAVEVQQADNREFSPPTTRYAGTDRGTVVTGLAEGTHWFRIRTEGSDAWSAPLPVTVEFLPRERLFLLLGIGGVVVVATLSMIIVGHFRNTRPGRLD